jgi:hypothetical protein
MSKMKMSGHRPAGGAGSKNVVRPPVRTGQKATGINPGGVSQLGEAVGNHGTGDRQHSTYRGDPWFDGKVPAGGNQKLGNQVAASTVCGPGGSRTVMRSGAQGQHGPANPGMPTSGAGKPIWPK